MRGGRVEQDAVDIEESGLHPRQRTGTRSLSAPLRLVLAFDGVVPLAVRPAVPQDAARILKLRLQAEEWLATRGVKQWGHGAVSFADIASQIGNGEWHVAGEESHSSAFCACFGRTSPFGSRTMSSPRTSMGLWCRESMLEKGSALPSCLGRHSKRSYETFGRFVSNAWSRTPRLRAYYSALGFREIGRRDFDGPWYSATLFEKTLHDNRYVPLSARRHPERVGDAASCPRRAYRSKPQR